MVFDIVRKIEQFNINVQCTELITATDGFLFMSQYCSVLAHHFGFNDITLYTFENSLNIKGRKIKIEKLWYFGEMANNAAKATNISQVLGSLQTQYQVHQIKIQSEKSADPMQLVKEIFQYCSFMSWHHCIFGGHTKVCMVGVW